MRNLLLRWAVLAFGVALCFAVRGEVLSTGAFVQSIPIDVPAGTNGVQPRLSLEYHSAQGVGFMGRGWSLSGLPSIHRHPASRAVAYSVADDYIDANGALVRSNDDGTEYRPRAQTWSRYVPSGACAGGWCSWSVQDKTGARLTFGGTLDARVLVPERDNAIHSWALSEFRNADGLSYRVSYSRDPAGHHIYPRRIVYTLGPGLTQFRSVEFLYDNATKPLPQTAQGLRSSEGKRLAWIVVKTGDYVVRSYALAYDSTGNMLTSVVEAGLIAKPISSPQSDQDWDEYATRLRSHLSRDEGYSSRAITMVYAPSPAQVQDVLSDPAAEGAWRRLELKDLQGQALALRSQAKATRLIEGSPSGNNAFSIQTASQVDRIVRLAPAGAGKVQVLSDPQFLFAGEARTASQTFPVPAAGISRTYEFHDFNGDLRKDLLVLSSDGKNQLFIASANGEFRSQDISAMPIASAKLLTPAEQELHFADVDGDGRTDIIVRPMNGSPLKVWLCQGTSFAEAAGFASTDAGIANTAGTILMRDFNGDGRADVMRRGIDGKNILFLSDGTRFAKSAELNGINLNANTVRVIDDADFDGDRRIDVLVLTPGKDVAQLYVQADGGFQSTEIPLLQQGEKVVTPALADIVVLDADGDGSRDLLLISSDVNRHRLLFWAGRSFTGAGATGLEGKNLTGKFAGDFVRDFNGDGLSDLFLVESDNTASLLLSEGTGFRSVPVPALTPPLAYRSGGVQQFELLDLDGDRRTDILFTMSSGSTAALLSNFAVPGVLTSINTPTGATVKVTYGFSRDLMPVADLQAKACAQPGRPLVETCGIADPSDQLIVERVEADGRRKPADGVATEETRYAYEDARLVRGDGGALTLGGVRAQTITDVRSGVATRTTFHQLLPFTGRPDEIHSYLSGSPAAPFKIQRFEYKDISNAQAHRLIVESARTTHHFERTVRTAEVLLENVYDAYGYVTRSRSCIDGECQLTVNQYVHDDATWTFGLLHEAEVRVGGNVLKKERRNYEGRRLRSSQALLCPEAESCSEEKGRWVEMQSEIAYDAYGNIVSSRGVEGRITRSAFDPVFHTHEVEAVNHLGHSTRHEYDAALRRIRTTDENGRSTRFEYDAFGQLAAVQGPDGSQTRYTRFRQGDPARQHEEIRRLESNMSEHVERIYSDGFGFAYRIERSGDRGGLITVDRDQYYKSGTRFQQESYPYSSAEKPQWRATQTDGLGRKLRTWDKGRLATTYRYEGRRSIATKHGTNGNSVMELELDGAGNAVSRTEAKGTNEQVSASFAYDAAGRLIRTTLKELGVQTPDGLERTYATAMRYDNFGRRTQVDSSEAGLTQIEYSDGGNIIKSSEANGKTTTSSYDALGRLVRKQSVGDTDLTFAYDGGAVDANTVGRLSKAVDNSTKREVHYRYDVAGRIADVAVVIPGLGTSAGARFQQQFEYDRRGRLIGKILPDGSAIRYAYSVAGNLLELQRNGVRVVNFENFTARGQPGSRELKSSASTDDHNLITRYGYDSEYRLTKLETSSHAGQTLQSLEYRFDDHDNVVDMFDRRSSTVVDGRETSEGQQFQYDRMDRLVKAVGHKTYGVKNFAYSPFGHVESLSGLESRTFQYNARGQIVNGNDGGLEAQYDAAGNTVTKRLGERKWTYRWGAGSQLLGIEEPSRVRARMSYDHVGLRQRKVVEDLENGSTTTTHYITRDYEMVEMVKRGADGVQQVSYREVVHVDAMDLGLVATIVNERRLSVQDGQPPLPSFNGLSSPPAAASDAEKGGVGDASASGVWFYHANHLGSVSLISDAKGEILSRITYLPFGEIDRNHSTIRTPVLRDFTGQESDDGTGLVYLQSRYYDPVIGRFISPDRVVSTTISLFALNRYAYAANSPIRFDDPSGHFSLHKLVREISNGVRDTGRFVGDVGRGAVNVIKGNAEAMTHIAERTIRYPLKVVEAPIDLYKAQEKVARQELLANGSLRSVAMVAASVYGGPGGAAALSSYLTLSAGGSVEDALRAGSLSFASSYAFAEVGGVQTSGFAEGAGKAVAMGVVGGTASSAQGGRFEDGFTAAFAPAVAQGLYEAFTHASPTFKPGGESVSKGPRPDGTPYSRWDLKPEVNNIGKFNEGLRETNWQYEGSAFMRGVNKIPGMNSMAFFHDHLAMAMSLDGALNMATIVVPAIPFNYYALGVTRDRFLLDQAIEEARNR